MLGNSRRHHQHEDMAELADAIDQAAGRHLKRIQAPQKQTEPKQNRRRAPPQGETPRWI
jgi:hypothetical protein